jgi:hypothetical protein
VREGQYINTINVASRVRINFVCFPGADRVNTSLVDTFVTDTAAGRRRNIFYIWQPDGGARVRRPMLSGQITLNLPPNTAGTLTCFGTQWRIARVANAVNMAAANTLRGVQQRLDRLGYHLRSPGARNPGIDNTLGRRTEIAILQFQCDYRPAAGAAAPANNRLKLRGEGTNNTNAAYTGNLQRYNNGAAVAPNPSVADSAALQASLVALVGG